MFDFFNENSPFLRFLTQLCNIIILNLLIIITSIPLITIGASLSAAYKITLDILAGDDPFIIKDYFKAFAKNFKQSTLIWLPLFVLACFFGYEVYLVNFVLSDNYMFLQYPVWIVLFILLSIVIYAFPQVSYFEEKTSQIIKNSVLIAVGNMPTTVFLTMIQITIFVICYVYHPATIIIGSFAVFFGFAGMILFYSLFIKKVLERSGAIIKVEKEKADD